MNNKASGSTQQALDTYQELAAANPKKDVAPTTKSSKDATNPSGTTSDTASNTAATGVTPDSTKEPRMGTVANVLDVFSTLEDIPASSATSHTDINTSLLLRRVSDKLNSAVDTEGLHDGHVVELMGQLNRQRVYDEAAEAILGQRSSRSLSPDELLSPTNSSDSGSTVEDCELPRTPSPIADETCSPHLPVVVNITLHNEAHHDHYELQAELVQDNEKISKPILATANAGLGITLSAGHDESCTLILQENIAREGGITSVSNSSPTFSTFRSAMEDFNKKHGLVFLDEEDEMELIIAEGNERQARAKAAEGSSRSEDVARGEESVADTGNHASEDAVTYNHNNTGPAEGASDRPAIGNAGNFTNEHYQESFKRPGQPASSRPKDDKQSSIPVTYHIAEHDPKIDGERNGRVRTYIRHGYHTPTSRRHAKFVCCNPHGFLEVFLGRGWNTTCVQPIYTPTTDERYQSERYLFDLAAECSTLEGDQGDFRQNADMRKLAMLSRIYNKHYFGMPGLPSEALFGSVSPRVSHSGQSSGDGVVWQYPRMDYCSRTDQLGKGRASKSRLREVESVDDFVAEVDTLEAETENSGELEDGNEPIPFKPSRWADGENEEMAAIETPPHPGQLNVDHEDDDLDMVDKNTQDTMERVVLDCRLGLGVDVTSPTIEETADNNVDEVEASSKEPTERSSGDYPCHNTTPEHEGLLTIAFFENDFEEFNSTPVSYVAYSTRSETARDVEGTKSLEDQAAENNKKHDLSFPDEDIQIDQINAEEKERQIHGIHFPNVKTPQDFAETSQDDQIETILTEANDGQAGIAEEDRGTYIRTPPADYVADENTLLVPVEELSGSKEDSVAEEITSGATQEELISTEHNVVAKEVVLSWNSWSVHDWAEESAHAAAVRTHYIDTVASSKQTARFIKETVIDRYRLPVYIPSSKYLCYDNHACLCVKFLTGRHQTNIRSLHNLNVNECFASERNAYDMAARMNKKDAKRALVQKFLAKNSFRQHYIALGRQHGLPVTMLFRSSSVHDAYSPEGSSVGIQWMFPRKSKKDRLETLRSARDLQIVAEDDEFYSEVCVSDLTKLVDCAQSRNSSGSGSASDGDMEEDFYDDGDTLSSNTSNSSAASSAEDSTEVARTDMKPFVVPGLESFPNRPNDISHFVGRSAAIMVLPSDSAVPTTLPDLSLRLISLLANAKNEARSRHGRMVGRAKVILIEQKRLKVLEEREAQKQKEDASRDRMRAFATNMKWGAAKTIKGLCWTASKAHELGLL